MTDGGDKGDILAEKIVGHNPRSGLYVCCFRIKLSTERRTSIFRTNISFLVQ
jgi:hypothetical protein